MRILKLVVIPVSFLLLVLSFWNRDALRDDMQFDSMLLNEPVQAAINENSYTTTVAGETYEVAPLYDYELTGLVVSYNVHSSVSLMHRMGHQLNVADFCVVWGDNVNDRPLSRYDFWNQEFTCNVRWAAGTEKIAWHQISNNHLISDDPDIRKQLNDIGIGDQIHIRGRLADYRNVKQSQFRETSTNRDDMGNGACETLIVDSVEILKSYTSTWRKLMYGAALIFLSALAMFLAAPFRVAH